MKDNKGFTLMEIMIVISIISILSAIAIPNGIAWMSNRRVNSAARDIFAMIQKARIEAVRQNARVVVTFDPDGNGTFENRYLAFVDADNDGVLDAGERTVYDSTLPPSVSISGIPLGAGAGKTSFDPRAIPSFSGPITLVNSGGQSVTVNLGSGGVPRVN